MGAFTGSVVELLVSQKDAERDVKILAYEIMMTAQELEIKRLMVANNKLCDIKTELQVEVFHLKEQLSQAKQ